MALLWAICDITGDGSPYPRQGYPERGPIRPVVDGLVNGYRCLMWPGIPWALVLVDGDPAAVAAIPGCDVLPDERLDTVLTNQRANQANNVLARRGLPELAAAGMTYREVIEAVARIIQPDFGVGWWPGAT